MYCKLKSLVLLIGISLALAACASAPATDAKNDSNTVIFANSVKLGSVKGWSREPSGKWIKKSKLIPLAIAQYKDTIVKYSNMFLHTTELDGADYIVLEVQEKEKSGFCTSWYYIFRSDEFSIQMKKDNSVMNNLSCSLSSYPHTSNWERPAMESIAATIRKENDSQSPFSFPLYFFTYYDVKNNDVRFFITRIINQKRSNNEFFTELPADNYFKCNYKNFVKFFSPVLTD